MDSQGLRTADIRTVTAIADDPRLIVVGPLTMPRADSYPSPSVGDSVLVVRLAGGSWLAVCKLAS